MVVGEPVLVFVLGQDVHGLGAGATLVFEVDILHVAVNTKDETDYEFGADTKLWYNTDVPGFSIQMPQILAKSGVDKAYMARSWNIEGVRTDFLNWSSPDGSSVFCYFMNHYADNISWRPGSRAWRLWCPLRPRVFRPSPLGHRPLPLRPVAAAMIA